MQCNVDDLQNNQSEQNKRMNVNILLLDERQCRGSGVGNASLEVNAIKVVEE